MNQVPETRPDHLLEWKPVQQAQESGFVKLHSYPKILALGHKLLADLFNGPVIVEEKVDGSQFSFGKKDGQLFFRSRGAAVYPETADKLFKAAVEYVVSIQDRLHDGWTYRGEVLHAPRHNTLTYGRIPRNHIALFDVEISEQAYLTDVVDKYEEANRLGLESVPAFYTGEITSKEQLQALLETESFLGGCKLEGIVVKNYNQFGVDRKVLMGKWVRDEFKEIHQGAWKKANPSKADFIEQIIAVYGTPQRWEKAIQHLREQGRLLDMPQDIGPLMKEINVDTLAECEAEIREKLFEFAWPKIARGITRGFAEYYKNRLLEIQFAPKEAA